MTLAQIGDAADLIAAFGVVATLLFLALELRSSNREARRANWRQFLDSLRAFKALSNDLTLSDLVIRGDADYHSLKPEEQRSYGLYIEQGIHVIGNFSRYSGDVPNELSGIEDTVNRMLTELLTSLGAIAWWREAKPKHRFLTQTEAMIDDIQKAGAAS